MRQLGENEGQPSEKVVVVESFAIFLGSLDKQKEERVLQVGY